MTAWFRTAREGALPVGLRAGDTSFSARGQVPEQSCLTISAQTADGGIRHKIAWGGERERERRERETFHLLVHSPNAYSSQGWAMQMPGTRKSMWDPHWHSRDWGCSEPHLLPPGVYASAGSCSPEVEPGLGTGTPVREAGVPAGILPTAPDTCPSQQPCTRSSPSAFSRPNASKGKKKLEKGSQSVSPNTRARRPLWKLCPGNRHTDTITQNLVGFASPGPYAPGSSLEAPVFIS